MKALFVCTGNTCRSPMAEQLFNHEAKRRGLGDWEAKSCGLSAALGMPLPGPARRALAERGIERAEHRSRQSSAELLRWADQVFAMTRAHRDALLAEYPEHRGKIQLFLEAAGLGSRDVDDPVGQTDEVYRSCRDQLEQGIKALLQKHAPSTADPRS